MGARGDARGIARGAWRGACARARAHVDRLIGALHDLVDGFLLRHVLQRADKEYRLGATRASTDACRGKALSVQRLGRRRRAQAWRV